MSGWGFVFTGPTSHVVLEYLWLLKNSTVIKWVERRIETWSPKCLAGCLCFVVSFNTETRYIVVRLIFPKFCPYIMIWHLLLICKILSLSDSPSSLWLYYRSPIWSPTSFQPFIQIIWTQEKYNEEIYWDVISLRNHSSFYISTGGRFLLCRKERQAYASLFDFWSLNQTTIKTSTPYLIWPQYLNIFTLPKCSPIWT